MQVFDLEDAEASVDPPLDSGLSQGVCFWVDMFMMIFILIDDLMLTFLTWFLVMQADDSLST